MRSVRLGPRSLSVLGLSALACGLVFLVYGPAIDGLLVFDDIPLLKNQQCWRGLGNIPSFFGLAPDGGGCTYRPIRYVTYALDFQLAGLSTEALHVSNLLYHCLVMGLLFALLVRLGSVRSAAILAFLWAVHPANSDVAAYISGRRDIVAGLFFIAALLPLVRDDLSRTGLRHGLAAIVFFVLAVLSKEMAITLPVVALLYLGLQHRSQVLGHLRRAWWIYLVLGAVAAWAVVEMGFVHSRSNRTEWWGGSLTTNFATVFALVPRYLELVIWPARLIGDYYPVTIPLASSFSDPRTLLGVTILVALLAGAWVCIRRGNGVSGFGLLWFVITLLPVAQIIPHHELFAEHYLYIPLMGLAIAALPLVDSILARRAGLLKALGTGVLMLAIFGAALRTNARASDWQDERTFNEAARRYAPDNLRVLYTLGVSYAEEGLCDQAIDVLEGALPRMSPRGVMWENSLVAVILCADARADDARRRDAVHALLEGDPNQPFGLAHRGRDRLERGELADAAADFEASLLASQVADRETIFYLAMTFNRMARHADALALIDVTRVESPRICAQEVHAHVALGVDHYPRAFDRANECLGSYPGSLALLDLRARLWLSQGRPSDARVDLETLRELGAPADMLRALEQALAVD